jgi:hypothetical protein
LFSSFFELQCDLHSLAAGPTGRPARTREFEWVAAQVSEPHIAVMVSDLDEFSLVRVDELAKFERLVTGDLERELQSHPAVSTSDVRVQGTVHGPHTQNSRRQGF